MPKAKPTRKRPSSKRFGARGRRTCSKSARQTTRFPGEEVSLKLYRLEAATAQILTQIERYPEKLPQVRRLIQYYLPTTLKLVKAYCSFETEHARGTEIEKTKQEILQALDTINAAFETLLKRLYEHEALDLSSDIAALEAMLAQEGLTGSDFSKT